MAVKHWNDMTEAERDAENARVEAAETEVSAMSDDELRALVDPVRDQPPGQWSEDQLRADTELYRRERDAEGGFVPETNEQIAAHPGTVHISLRMPAGLLERLRVEAERRGTRYQTLMKELLEEGLDRPFGAPRPDAVHVRLSLADLIQLGQGRSLAIDLDPTTPDRAVVGRALRGVPPTQTAEIVATLVRLGLIEPRGIRKTSRRPGTPGGGRRRADILPDPRSEG